MIDATMTRRRLLLRTLAPLWLPVLALASWFAASARSTNFYFPPLSTILSTLWDELIHGPLVSDTVFSLRNIVVGMLVGLVLGVLLGAVIGDLPALDRATTPLLTFARATPTVAFVPVIILTLGIGAAPKVFLIALGTFWPVLLNTVSGVRGISPAIRETARGYRIPWHLRMRRVILPAALPQIFAGLRVALSVAVVLMVVSEIYGSAIGLGNFILQSGSAFHVADTWAGTVYIGLLGYLLSVLVVFLEHASLGWYFERAPRTRGGPTARPIGSGP